MSDIEQLVLTHTRRVTGQPELAIDDLDASFESLGIDSLHLSEVAVAVLTELDVYIPMAQLARAQTPAAFLAMLEDAG